MRVDESKLYVTAARMSGAEAATGELTNPGRVDRRRLQNGPRCLFQPSARIFARKLCLSARETPTESNDLHRTANGWDGRTLFHDNTPGRTDVCSSC